MTKDNFQFSEITNERDDELEDEELIEEDEENEEEELQSLHAKTSMAKLKSLHKLKSVSAALLVAAGMVGSNAIAQTTTNTNSGFSNTVRNTSWYLGASVGKANGDVDSSNVGAGFSGSIDDRDTGWKVYGGGMFNQNLGLELGYVDLGTTSIRGNIGGVTTNMDSDAEGISLALVGAIPLGQFTSYGQGLSLTGKVGLFRWKADDRQYSCSGGSCTTRGEQRDTDPVVGVGLKYDFSRNLAVRLDYEQYQNVANTDYNLWTIGLQAGF